MENMKCENCGGMMKEKDNATMMCESCGITKSMNMEREDGMDEVEEEKKEDKSDTTTEIP